MTPAQEKALELHQPLVQPGPHAEASEKQLWREAMSIRASISDRTWSQKVAAFRKLYNLSRFNNPVPGQVSPLRSMLHRGLHAEEFGEAMGWSKQRIQQLVHAARDSTPEAVSFDDWIEQLDGRLDLIYTLLGELDEMLNDPALTDLLFAEVHASNLTKVDGEGQPVYDDNGKVLKGSNYVKADLVAVIQRYLKAETSDG